MYFISRLLQPFRAFFNALFSPFARLTYSLRNFRSNNPITMAMRSLAMQRQQLNYYRKLPGNYASMFRIPMPRWVKENKFWKEFRESLSDLRPQSRSEADLIRIQRGAKLPQVAQHSQIHLINQRTGERHILHIGTEIGKSTAEITLNNGVRLRFRQIDPDQYNANTMVTQVAGKAKVTIDERLLERAARIYDESVISIPPDAYSIETYAWARFPEEIRVDAVWATTSGPVRPRNEDAIGLFQHPKGYMFVVADGVGGGYAGDEVSRFATQYMLAVFSRNIPYDLPWSEIYERAYETINVDVRKFSEKAPDIAGTTLTSLVIKDWDAYVAHVGDSRLYHMQGGVLEQVTADHTVQNAKRDERFYDLTSTARAKDVLLYDAALDGPLEEEVGRTVLSRAIGKSSYISVDYYTRRLQPGDKLLLCSDGVWSTVSHNEMSEALRKMPLERLPEHLIARAYEEGSDDNAAVVVVEVLKDAYQRDRWLAKSSERVFAGNQPRSALKLRKPRELDTDYGTSPAGCALWLVLIAALIALGVWGIPRLNNNGAITGAADDPPTLTATNTLAPITDTPSPTVDVTATPSPSPTRTHTPTITFEPRSVQPTSTPLPPTPVPPTATLRVSLDSARQARYALQYHALSSAHAASFSLDLNAVEAAPMQTEFSA